MTVNREVGFENTDKGTVWTAPVLVKLSVGMPDVRNRPNATPDAVLGQSSLS